jgi:hypothetical protein
MIYYLAFLPVDWSFYILLSSVFLLSDWDQDIPWVEFLGVSIRIAEIFIPFLLKFLLQDTFQMRFRKYQQSNYWNLQKTVKLVLKTQIKLANIKKCGSQHNESFHCSFCFISNIIQFFMIHFTAQHVFFREVNSIIFHTYLALRFCTWKFSQHVRNLR